MPTRIRPAWLRRLLTCRFEDSLDVYAAATQQEKKDIRRAVASKIVSYYSLVEKGKKSSADYKAVQPRIQKFFQDKP